MLKPFKILGGAVLAAGLVQSVSAFSLLGPKEAWQTTALGYTGGFEDAPHNLGEEFRWNVPILYYTCDQSFLEFFGTKGSSEVDAAMNLLSLTLSNAANGVTGVASWSADLHEFPLEGRQVNYTAAALHLFDVRSCVMETMMEHLGLADPERFTWTLRGRAAAPTCPSMTYGVVKRNYDPVTQLPSIYVNGVLYTYVILEGCPTVDEAIAEPVAVDSSANYGTALASGKLMFADITAYGSYYTGLTRDDAGGLRYLFQTNNVNIENSGPASVTTYVTNFVPQLLQTSNLTAFAQAALTNDDAGLLALYPGVLYAGVATNFFTNVWTTNITAYYTNSPWDPYGTLPHQAYATNRVETVRSYYVHSFANVALVQYANNAWTSVLAQDITGVKQPAFAALQTVNVSSGSAFTPVGSSVLQTNVSTRTFLTDTVSGEFFFLPAGACTVQILANQMTLTNVSTNVLFTASNTTAVYSAGGTGTASNTVVATNFSSVQQSLLTYGTSHIFEVFPVTCPSNYLSARQGMNTIQFVRRDYDSLINRYWTPITNQWTTWVVTNNSRFLQTFTRVVTVPDIEFTAADIAQTIAPIAVVDFTVSRPTPTWDTNGVPVNNGAGALAGPGTIEPPGIGGATATFTFNKVGQVYNNFGPLYMDEGSAYTDYQWASFNGTTNAPVIYPDASNLNSFQNQLVLETFPLSLPNGQAAVPYTFSYVNSASGAAYTNQFSGTGGTAPYAFSVTPGFSLPAGLTLQADGTVTGTPAAVGTFAFDIRMTDAGARFIDTPYTVTISPP